MGNGAISNNTPPASNDYTKTIKISSVDKGDTDHNSAARKMIADGDITVAELTAAKVDIPDMTKSNFNPTSAKLKMIKQLETAGFSNGAANTIAGRIIGLRSDNQFIGEGKPVTVQDPSIKEKIGEKQVGVERTNVVDRSTWEGNIKTIKADTRPLTAFTKDAAGIKAETNANFSVMIDTFGPKNPTGGDDFATAIKNGFPDPKTCTITKDECKELLGLMQNASSGTDVARLQTLLCKIDPEFGKVLAKNGNIDGKLGVMTTVASKMLDAAVKLTEKPIMEPVYADKPQSHEEPTKTQGSFDIKLTDPPKSKSNFHWPHFSLPRGDGLHHGPKYHGQCFKFH